MTQSKAWDWQKLSERRINFWQEPAQESYYLINRWRVQRKKDFLDLGCGIGRHAIQFAKVGFNVSAFDLSPEAINKTRKWAKSENLEISCHVGDMLDLPYCDENFDCILCRNVISHTDTNGMRKIVSDIYRILRKKGECYLTLGSKSTWGYKQNWPVLDDNTKIRIEDGPENGIPHFYADDKLIFDLFSDFEIISLEHVEDFMIKDGQQGMEATSWHYHMLIRK